MNDPIQNSSIQVNGPSDGVAPRPPIPRVPQSDNPIEIADPALIEKDPLHPDDRDKEEMD